MSYEIFIDDLLLDTFKCSDPEDWYQLVKNGYIKYSHSIYKPALYVEYINEKETVHHTYYDFWIVLNPFIVINEICPKRDTLQRGELVAVLSHADYDIYAILSKRHLSPLRSIFGTKIIAIKNALLVYCRKKFPK